MTIKGDIFWENPITVVTRTNNGFVFDTHGFSKQTINDIFISVVDAKEFLVGKSFSVRESLNGWSEATMNILDVLIGLPDLQTKHLELKLHEERAKYLVCELKCPFEDSLAQYISFIRQMIVKNSTEKGRIEDEKAPMLNFIFTTPQV